MAKPALILHGGAGARRERNYDAEVVHMREVVEAMKARLDAGASALDVAVEAVVMLEDSGLYVAGRGASPNLAGDYELDASLMDGASGKAGAVAALQGFRNPVVAARAVMDRTPTSCWPETAPPVSPPNRVWRASKIPRPGTPAPVRARTTIRPAA